jgi:protein tyrosine/serine phosphatase
MSASTYRAATLTVVLLLTAASVAPLTQDAATGVPVDRLHKVDDRLYRGAQPDLEGFRHLRDLGIRTVVNLREEKDAVKTGEQKIVESLGMRYVSLPVKDGNFFTWFRRIPEDSVKQFLAIVQTEPAPLFVHCRRGTDRTGAMVAFYRMATSGWDARRATDEADDVGMRFWYRGLRRQIKEFTAAVATQ